MTRKSIRKQLLVLFVPFVFGLWIASAAVGFWLISTLSADSFDKDLLNSADSVVGRLRTKEGKVVADLPPAALAILKHDEADKLFFSVLSVDGKHIAGDNVIPVPAGDLSLKSPRVVDGQIAGKDVRIAEIKASVDSGETVIVQVAETTNVRRTFQQKLLLSIAIPQLVVIFLAFAAVFYGIDRILTPLRTLQSQLSLRSEADFKALEENGAPSEVYPLVKAINNLFHKTEEKISAQHRFIANAAHQLRTPLAGLKTYTSLGPEINDLDELQELVRDVDRGVDRATRMVSQLLALARTDAKGETIASAVDLNFLVSDVVSELVHQAVLKNINLTFESSPTGAILAGEPMSLKHLVANLVENSILYTPPGGSILVRVQKNGQVKLTVSDTGPGIPAKERENIFERFYRIVGTKGEGSGLGLSIVKEVASKHKAKISIEDDPSNRGATFVVEFPAERE